MKPCYAEFKSVIDWIEFKVHVPQPSNFWTVQQTVENVLGVKAYVNALDAGNGNAATTFLIRLQNPNKPAVVRLVESLEQRYRKLTIHPTGIELAHDTFLADAGVRQLAEIAADRFRFLTSPPGDAWYFYRGKGEGRVFLDTLPQRRDLVERLQDFWQLTDRHDKECDVRYHAYVKTLDGGVSLPPERWCARIEVTLRGDALPFKSIADLLKFDFAKLARHFKYRRLSDDLHPALKVAMSSWSGRQHGKSGPYRRLVAGTIGVYSGTRIFRRWTVADEGTNAKVYECLRGLSRGWKSGRGSAAFPEHL